MGSVPLPLFSGFDAGQMQLTERGNCTLELEGIYLLVIYVVIFLPFSSGFVSYARHDSLLAQSHNTPALFYPPPPPKNIFLYHNHCLQFLLGREDVPTMPMQNFSERGRGGGGDTHSSEEKLGPRDPHVAKSPH